MKRYESMSKEEIIEFYMANAHTSPCFFAEHGESVGNYLYSEVREDEQETGSFNGKRFSDGITLADFLDLIDVNREGDEVIQLTNADEDCNWDDFDQFRIGSSFLDKFSNWNVTEVAAISKDVIRIGITE